MNTQYIVNAVLEKLSQEIKELDQLQVYKDSLIKKLLLNKTNYVKCMETIFNQQQLKNEFSGKQTDKNLVNCKTANLKKKTDILVINRFKTVQSRLCLI